MRDALRREQSAIYSGPDVPFDSHAARIPYQPSSSKSVVIASGEMLVLVLLAMKPGGIYAD